MACLLNSKSGQRTDAAQAKTGKALDALQSRKVNWLADKDMIRGHVPVAGIVRFGLNLKSLNDMMHTSNFTIDLADIANEIGGQLQDIRKQYGSRSVVFIGHGYGTLLIERLLDPNPSENKVSADLQESTAAVVLFAAPFHITPLIEWTSRSLGLSRDAKVFSNLQMRIGPEVWKSFNRHIAAWYMLTFAFQERQNEKEWEEEKDEAPPGNQQDEMKESKAIDEPQHLVCLAPETWEGEHAIGDIARMSGPRDPKFRTMTEFLTRAIHTHHMLAAAKRGDVDMIKEFAVRSIDVNLPNRQGETSLHVAVQYNRLDVVTALIETSKVDLDHQDVSGMTALHFAIRHNGDLVYAIVKELLEAGASPNLRGGPKSETLVELAERLYSESAQRQPNGDEDERLDNSQLRREMTKDLLKNPPPVSPPRPANRLVKEIPAIEARDACRKTVVVVREMFDTDSYIRYYTNIEQLIYESFSANDKNPADQELEDDNELKASLDTFFQNQKALQKQRGDISLEGKLAMCRWYHIPMNNVGLPLF